MRTYLLGGILVALLGLQGLHAAAAVDRVALDGLNAVVPADAGWRRTESTTRQVVFERTVDGQRTTLSYSAQPMEPVPEDKAFLRFAEDRQGKALSKLERVSLHYNWTHKQGAPCLVYDGIFQDKANQAAPFLSFRGQLCRHPDPAGKMLQVELAQRSDSKERAYEIDLSEEAEQVFGAVQFTELPAAGKSGS